MACRKQSFMSRMHLSYCISTCFFLFFTFISSVSTRSLCLELLSSSGRKTEYYLQELEKITDKKEDHESSGLELEKRSGFCINLRRRNLSGLGSSPPRCTSKCGKCKPCKPVHVLVPPGTLVTTEYYPEAWRCKCGNKFYMP